MQFHALDSLLLSRSGQVLQGLVRHFAAHPTDRHPTVDQLALVIGANRKFVSRGLKDLTAAGLIFLTLDQAHAVGRSIDLAPAVAELVARAIARGETEVGGQDRSVATEVGGQDRSVATEVAHLRSEVTPSEVDVTRRQATSVPGKGNGPEAGPLGDPLAKLLARHAAAIATEVAAANQSPKLANLGHLERQNRLPIDSPARPDPNLRLKTAIAALEAGQAGTVEQAVLKLNEHFDPDFEGVYRKVCGAVNRGFAPFGDLVEAIGEATRPGVRNKGAALVAAMARRFPTLVQLRNKASEPAAESIRQDPPTAGQESACMIQSSLATG